MALRFLQQCLAQVNAGDVQPQSRQWHGVAAGAAGKVEHPRGLRASQCQQAWTFLPGLFETARIKHGVVKSLPEIVVVEPVCGIVHGECKVMRGSGA